MYAIIETGGKQFRVEKGTVISVDLLAAEQGAGFETDKVLLVKDGNDVKVGAPHVSGAKVSGTILEHYKGKKVVIFKHKRRKGYRLKKGHRQNYSKVKIESIAV